MDNEVWLTTKLLEVEALKVEKTAMEQDGGYNEIAFFEIAQKIRTIIREIEDRYGKS